MRKKAWALTIAPIAALSLALAGCGGGANEDNGAAAGQGSGASSGEQVTLKFWYPTAEQIAIDAVNAQIDKFESLHPDIKVELTTIPFSEYFQKLSVAYSGGLQPDVHGLGFGQLISTVGQGKYLDLQPYIDKDSWEGKDDFFPDILKAGQWQGGQYGLLLPEIRPLAWRKDFFEEAGLDPESPPKTVDELFELANKLKVVENGKTVRAGIDIATSNGEQPYLSLLLLLGEDFYDDEGNPTFDSDTSIKLVERMVQLYKDGAIIPYNSQQVGGSTFTQSQAAMAFVSTAGAAALKQSAGADKIGWALPPEGAAGNRTSLVLGTFLTAAKNTKHPEEAWEFLKFWFEKDNVFEFATKTGFIPPLQSLKDEYVKLSPENEISFEALNHAQGYRASELWGINVKYLRLALEEAYNGVKPAADALKDNAKLARDEIAGLK